MKYATKLFAQFRVHNLQVDVQILDIFKGPFLGNLQKFWKKSITKKFVLEHGWEQSCPRAYNFYSEGALKFTSRKNIFPFFGFEKKPTVLSGGVCDVLKNNVPLIWVSSKTGLTPPHTQDFCNFWDTFTNVNLKKKIWHFLCCNSPNIWEKVPQNY